MTTGPLTLYQPGNNTKAVSFAVGCTSLPGRTAPLVTELLQLQVPGYGTVYCHISEMLTYRTVSSSSH